MKDSSITAFKNGTGLVKNNRRMCICEYDSPISGKGGILTIKAFHKKDIECKNLAIVKVTRKRVSTITIGLTDDGLYDLYYLLGQEIERRNTITFTKP